MEAWEKDPASKPKYDNSSKNRDLSSILKIFSTRSSEPRRVFDTCAYCHGNKKNMFVGFKGGDAYADYALPFLISEPIPDNDLQGEFWPDGRPNRFNRPQALTLSGCFKAGAVTCTNCHVAHGSRNEFSLKVNINQGRNGDALCTQCHTQPAYAGATLKQHTFHAPESAGSRCISCHMSDVNWRLLIRRRDHTMQPPVPETTAQFGIPNACTTCHDDRPPEWAARQMDAWWRNGERRSKVVQLADTMYRAGSGDPSTLPALASLAVDRNQGAVIRASAADYIGILVSRSRGGLLPARGDAQSQTSFIRRSREAPVPRPAGGPLLVPPAIVNALIGAAADPEPMVRAAAVRALGIIGDRERALGPVLARLVDRTRVVRARAADVLETFGVVELPGHAGERLRAAQAEFVAGLQSFPDVVSQHAVLGWFEAQRGNLDAAHRALDDALRLQPSHAYALVVKGVLFARAGNFADAVVMWKKARSIEPSFPNIDQLIAEGEKRR
jgi:predicted CXXCH cytochrome family protein